MAKALSRCVAAAALAVAADAAHWAVIMAGSNGYGNYRHQADACHAYQVAVAHGIPASNIILLAYDDIASSGENPFPGKLYNKPNGQDVYAGCQISYRGEQVTAATFLKVLRGDATAGGPVLHSTAEDRVFVFYSDHGAPGILGTPVGDPIHAADLNAALTEMHQKGMYKQLLFYLEACESGSMFAGLLKAPNVKAVTAANPSESSWGFYCPPQDMVGGKAIGSCLGDEFSINWMEDADAATFATETVGQQVTRVTQKTTKSHVMQYGDASLDAEAVGVFEGSQGFQRTAGLPLQAEDSAAFRDSAVSSRDVELHLAYWAVRRAATAHQKRHAEARLQAVLARRSAEDAKFQEVALAAAGGNASLAQQHLDGPVERITQVQCHKAAVQAALQHCGPFTDYSIRHSRLLANLCESGMAPAEVERSLRDGCAASAVRATASCSGSAEPVAGTCYKGSAGALGVTETVQLDLVSYAAGAGSANFQASGLKSVSCQNVAFTKRGQDIAVDLSACLPDGVTVSAVKYCSDTDSVQVTVADKALPVPITATMARTPCNSDSQLVV